MKTNKKDIISILLGNTLLALAVILFIVPGHFIKWRDNRYFFIF